MAFIEVEINNWARFNPRKDYKRPSWFALDNRIVESPSMLELSAEEFRAWIYILCQASQKNMGRVKIYFKHALQVCSITQKAILGAIDKLEKDESIQVTVRDPNGSVQMANGSVRNPNATNKQTNITPVGKAALPPLAVLWNTKARRLAKIKKIDSKREALIEKHKSEYDDTHWSEIFEKANNSNFLCGEGSKGWKATFNWVLKNAHRIDEGEFPADAPAAARLVL